MGFEFLAGESELTFLLFYFIFSSHLYSSLFTSLLFHFHFIPFSFLFPPSPFPSLQVCALCGSLPLAILIPAIPSLYELEGDAKSVRDQCSDIWHMVQLKAVWRPMAFIYIYNMFQTPNTAWNSYLQLTLHFPAWFLGFIALVGSVMTFAGIVAYKKYFFKSSWRFIYAFSSITTTIFSAMQLLLIFQINERYLGISNYPFAMGDDVLQQFLSGIQFLPSCVM